ncbi:hypothetical protein PIB30_064319 [Stylosanthes scabra]|uniref:Uncharacterized protein n=1 Tax=Stylosanthes scabra TaxID=79078 RepID=A0ABU6TLF3_9FABA|nr:hypothetical protein [Stylosanthes scabra]
MVDFFPSERDQRGLQGGHQGKRLSAACILPHGGRQCSGLFTGKRSSSAASTRQGFKETDSGAQSLELAGGGPARPLRRSSQQSVLERVKYKRKKIAYHDLRLE